MVDSTPPSADKTFVGTHLDEAEYAALKAFAARHHRSIAATLRMAIEEKVKEEPVTT